MSSLSSIYIKTETLRTLFETLDKKGEKGIEITISISDEVNEYDQNLSGFVAQTKEQRESKKTRFYVGNGRTFWTDGTIQVPKKKEETHTAEVVAEDKDDLPF